MIEHDEQLTAPIETTSDVQAERARDRREFFRTALGAATVTIVGAAAVTIGSGALAQSTGDMDLLNAALNVEYLAASFYSAAANGTPLSASLLTGTGTQGTVTGGAKVTFTDPVVAKIAGEIAADKIAHVTSLRATLGSYAVAIPSIDIGSTATSAFSVAMRAAGVVGTGVAFDPYASDSNFLLAAFLLEDVLATQYKAVMTLLTDKGYVETNAGLLGTSAYHAAIIRTTLYVKGATTAALRTQADAMSNVRDGVDGTSDDDQGISPATLSAATAPYATALQGLVASNIVPTGPDGLAYGRAPATALNIFFLSSTAVAKGGFFPNGVSGPYNTSTAN